MNLQEFIEHEENGNDEELNEALRVFKQSKKFKDFADKIEEKLITAKSKGKIEDDKAKMIDEVVKEARMASQEFERVEDKFKEKKIDRKKAKEEIKRLKNKYSGLVKKMKSETTKKAMRAIGAVAAFAGLAGLLGGVLGIGTGGSEFFMTGADMGGGQVFKAPRG